MSQKFNSSTHVHTHTYSTHTNMLQYAHISKHSHTNAQKKTHASQGHCQGCKDFPSDVFPLAWRETLPAHQPPPTLPPFLLLFCPSSLSTILQKPHDTQRQVKGERDPKIKTTSHPPSPRILRHPPNTQTPGYLSLLPTSCSPALHNWRID